MASTPQGLNTYSYASLFREAEAHGIKLTDEDLAHGFSIVDFSFFLEPHNTCDSILRQSIHHICLPEEVHQICFEWKKSEDEEEFSDSNIIWKALLNFTNYLTRLIPSINGEPLLDHCIDMAVRAYYEKTHEQHKERQYDPGAKLRSFILGLIQPVPEILHHQIFADMNDDWKLWPPLSEPLYEWLQRFRPMKLLVIPISGISEVNSSLARIQVAHTIFPFKELSLAEIDWKSFLNEGGIGLKKQITH